MKRTSLTWITASPLILLTVVLGFAAAQTAKIAKTDAEINRRSSQSIASYKGNCPCRYSGIAQAGCADTALRTVAQDVLRRFATSGM